jgi:hypothetical protein
MNGAKRVGDTMPTYKDLVELAQICLGQAPTAQNSEASAALYQLARDYNRRAAELGAARNLPLQQGLPT